MRGMRKGSGERRRGGESYQQDEIDCGEDHGEDEEEDGKDHEPEQK
jgi:hypothetical protein